tara:strand:+ start:1923 stop:2036 length:114 start_codon:yes stop_codon:yes gene_type:complete
MKDETLSFVTKSNDLLKNLTCFDLMIRYYLAEDQGVE